MGICHPNQDLDFKPFCIKRPDIKAHATCSPDDTSTSYSE